MSKALLRALRAKSGGGFETSRSLVSQDLVKGLFAYWILLAQTKKSVKPVAKPLLGQGGSAEPAAILDAPWA